MNVSIDTNIFCQDFNLDGTQFRIFLSGLDLVPAKLFVPHVVIDETVTKFAEALTDQVRTHERSSHDLHRLLPKSKHVPIVQLDISTEKRDYASRLLKALEAHGTKILPYPKTSHETIVARELLRRRPFRKAGGGYRDFLIWESVRHLILEGPELAAFITNNTRDFGEWPDLEPDLAQDVMNPSQFKIIRSLTAFNDEFVVPRLKTIDDAKRRLQESNLNGFDFRQWLQSGLVELLRNYELEDVLAGLEPHMVSTWIKRVSLILTSEGKVEEQELMEIEGAGGRTQFVI